MPAGRASGTVTVLFTDLVGSTELMARLGAEAFDKVRQAHSTALRHALSAHGGEEIKNTGDGLMVTFASVADAVRCAVAMQQATDRHARSGPVGLAMRIGLSVGDVTLEDGDVFGAPVVEAARLVAAAGPAKILTTAIARALAGGRADVEFVDLGPMEFKGLPAPLPACEVLWPPAAPSIPMPPLLTDIGRVFVGRDGEVERLSQLWKEAVAGERRVALLAGEPGVGKTRLAAELAEAAHAEAAVVLAGRCDEDLGVPYQPFVEALRHYVDHAVEPRLGRYGGELTRLVAELADRVPGLAPPLRSDPETERYRLFDAVAAWLGAASTDQPVLLLLDDLQWAAKPTLLLLRHVVRSPEPARVLVVGTYRDTEFGHDHPLVAVLADLRRQEGVERLSLTGLDSSAVAAFMEQAARHQLDDEDLALARAIYEETEGNPFFVREVLRHLTETGAIQRGEGRWGARLSVEDFGIPEGVREVVGRRLSRLSEDANRVLRVAAVVGSEFDLAVLHAATEDLVEEDVVSALEETSQARLLLETTQPAGRYRFAHALVRDTLYQGLSAARRVTLHRRVAEAIEEVHSAALDDYLPALAHHWARASAPAAETTRAVHYAARAGDRALAQLAHDEAVAYYRQALELLGVAEGPPHEAGRLELLMSLGEAQRRAGDANFRRTLLDAARLAQRRGDAPAMARAALANTRGSLMASFGSVDADRVAALEAALGAVEGGDDRIKAQILASLGLELTLSRDREPCRRFSDAALDLARRLDEPATLAHVLLARHHTIAGPDTLSERLANTAELVEVCARLGDPVATCRTSYIRVRLAMETGNVEEAGHVLDEWERVATELGEPTLRWNACWARAAWTLRTGRIAEAEALARESSELADATGQPDADVLGAYQLFGIRYEQGRLEEIRSLLADVVRQNPGVTPLTAALGLLDCELDQPTEAQARFVEAGDFASIPLDLFWSFTMACWATVAAHLGDRQRAQAVYQVLAPYPDLVAGVGTIWLGSVSHYLGLLATTFGRYDRADQHLAAAAEAHERMQAPVWLARTRLEWARMLLTRRQSGDAGRARDLLGPALGTARELGLGTVERRAVSLLGELG